MPTVFPGRDVIGSFEFTEKLLTRALNVIPYCPEHADVWSPRLTTIILEACSQFDSLLNMNATGKKLARRRDKCSIEHYFQWFGADLAELWTVFFMADQPILLRPFGAWRGATAFTRKNYQTSPLTWWGAYNRLKHNRLENRQAGTLANAVDAVAALFLAIIRSELCYEPAIDAGWLSSGHVDGSLPEFSHIQVGDWLAAETKLFAHPVGWCNQLVLKHHGWPGRASHRFHAWFSSFEQKPGGDGP